MRLTAALATAVSVVAVATAKSSSSPAKYPTKSGIKSWVDPGTPDDRQTFVNSRGRKWDLVMSDEFNVANRSFRPGDDHIWTSLGKPDGVNGALEIYSHNMTSTKCEGDTCYFYIEVSDEPQTISVYNMYKYPPGYEDAHFYYRAGMVQSWNKFCFQGGMLEVRAQLPDVFNPDNQRISACDDDPGYGLNPNQGRGAPEIDVLEGGGLAISSSLQIAPGMPDDFRLFPADAKGADATNPYCVYTYDCLTPGANMMDVPTAYYKKERGHKSWYQGLRYGANNYCQQDATLKQDYDTVVAAVKAGITENTCTVDTCPASADVNGDMSVMGDSKTAHWGINSNGTCYPLMNSYMGAYLCDPDNTDSKCTSPRNSTTPKYNSMSEFNYQMDAISSNWPIHLGGLPQLDGLRGGVEGGTGSYVGTQG
uniref:GH16 domain-containing protein n=1 Tax=Phytophthora ramorum TaxID=164328 RepID=H3GES0_PHYRM